MVQRKHLVLEKARSHLANTNKYKPTIDIDSHYVVSIIYYKQWHQFLVYIKGLFSQGTTYLYLSFQGYMICIPAFPFD